MPIPAFVCRFRHAVCGRGRSVTNVTQLTQMGADEVRPRPREETALVVGHVSCVTGTILPNRGPIPALIPRQIQGSQAGRPRPTVGACFDKARYRLERAMTILLPGQPGARSALAGAFTISLVTYISSATQHLNIGSSPCCPSGACNPSRRIFRIATGTTTAPGRLLQANADSSVVKAWNPVKYRPPRRVRAIC
jgi:hypothetical protein